MEPDQSSKEDIAPLRERLLLNFGTNKVLCRPNTVSGVMPNTGEDDTTLTTDNANPSDKIRGGLNFEFGGRLSKVKENAQQSWSRKGKLVVSKNGLVKSKVKGIGKRGIMDIPQGRRGTDSSGTSSSGQDKDDADDTSSTHERKRDASKSPVFGKVRSSDHAENRKRTRGLPRSFDWEDNIPDILGEDKTRTGCDKRKSHDHKDGTQHYRRRNGLCFSSNRHQSKEGKGHDLNIADHKFLDPEQQAAGVFHSELGLGSIRYDPRFYPNVEEEGRKHGHRHSDSRHFTEMEKRRQQRKYEPKDTERRENMTSNREQLDPKSTLRYNKFLAKKHKREQKKADGDSSKMSSGSAGVILNQDLQPERFYSEGKSNRMNSRYLRDKPSASSLKENLIEGQNDLVTSSSKLDDGEVDTASDLRDRKQTEQRNQKLTSDSTQHSIESISPIAATDSLLDHDSDRTPLDLSLTINSQGSRRTSKRRKVHSVAQEAVILDDEDDREVILDGMTFVDTPPGRHRGGECGPRSVTEIIDDEEEDDDAVILLGDGDPTRTPRRVNRTRDDMAIQGVDITPQTAAAIQQLEADEAMARRLQLEFDREEATLATPQHPQFNIQDFGSHHHQHLIGSMVQSLVTEFAPESNPAPISFSFTSQMMPWLDLPQEPRTRRRGPPQRGNRRGRRLANLPHVEPGQDDYERLLDLAEHLGPAVPQGLAVEVLSRLPTFRFQESDSGHQLKEEDKSCTICMGDYETNEELRRLPCFHAYHTTCIDKWFEQNSACPICRVRVQLD